MAILEVRGITKRFGGLVAVHKLDMTIEQGEILGHNADPPSDLDGRTAVAEILPQDPHTAVGGGQKPREHLDRRGLARPVGAQESVEAAGLHIQVQTVHCTEVSEAAGQGAGLDRVGHGGHCGNSQCGCQAALEPIRITPLASPGCKGRWQRRSPSTIISNIACFDLLALDPFARARADDGFFG